MRIINRGPDTTSCKISDGILPCLIDCLRMYECICNAASNAVPCDGPPHWSSHSSVLDRTDATCKPVADERTSKLSKGLYIQFFCHDYQLASGIGAFKLTKAWSLVFDISASCYSCQVVC